jgi:hypothetical protein
MNQQQDVSNIEQREISASNWRAWLGEDPRVAEDPSLLDMVGSEPVWHESGPVFRRSKLRTSDDEFD